ncbi:MAG: co-chaperone DjlA [Porticoccaceae bacterium]
MWYGKLIGGLIGLLAGGPFGLIIGVLVGHYFDRAMGGFTTRMTPAERQHVEESFFRTVFLMMGRLAKSDGRVSEVEIAYIEQLMTQMGLTADHRQRAIAIFKEGVAGQFDIASELTSFRSICAKHPVLSQQLLNYLLSLALADGALSADEEAFLRQVATGLGISPRLFEQLLRMIRAQTHFRRDGGQSQSRYDPPGRDELSLAYEALGIDESVTDAELKKAYRRLMSENHPDKLTGQGVPEDMIKLATERSQEIQTAYDLIKKHRGL